MPTYRTSTKSTRWIAAIAVPEALVATGAIIVPLSASAAPNLPEKSPTAVLELLASNDVDALSGTVVVTSELGLPDLSGFTVPEGSGTDDSSESSDDPAASPDSLGSALDLLTGTHDARVFVDGPTKARVQVLDELAERDVVRNGDDVWLYDSTDNTAVHTTLPEIDESKIGETAAPDAAAPEATTPDAAAKSIVEALEPSSELSVSTTQRVAGRDAYTLVLEPKDDGTLVDNVSIAIDAETGLGLSVTVTAKDATEPAFDLAFSKLDLDTPSADLFAFTPPADATVTEEELPAAPTEAQSDVEHAEPEYSVTGEGWASVVSIVVGDDLEELATSPQFEQLSSEVDGGRVISTALVNVLVTDDGDVLAGSVPVATLQAAAK
jgi:outer membrane lipoprotein-sorting protein